MSGVEVKFEKIHPEAQAPLRASSGAACFDLFSTEACVLGPDAGTTRIVGTGLKFAIPPGMVMLIFSRSGMGFNDNVRLANCVGVIDSDYRGEVKVKLTSDDKRLKRYPAGSRIAQAMLVALPLVEMTEADSLDETERMHGGFGSTGM